MNDLGLTLAWLAVQVALLLAPALVLHALASRRGPAAGAWVAALSLGLVVVLNVAAFLPGIGLRTARPWSTARSRRRRCRIRTAPAIPTGSTGSGRRPRRHRPAAGRGRSLAWLASGLGPARARGGRAGGAVSGRGGARWRSLALAGTGVGLLRLAIGLWAVAALPPSRAAGRRPGDDRLCSTSCGGRWDVAAPVELREVPDLTTPATAGWRRPVILLPDDWRSWSDAERRAVLAHELAHIVRGDYAAGLLARLAVVLNDYHPLVRWMAGRLQLQQELAADAMGARFAGGRARYLVALSRLALRQDGRSPCWPARAFLPARGTLIRRIAMLRDRIPDRRPFDRPWSRARRLAHGVRPARPDARRGDAPRPGPRRRGRPSPPRPRPAVAATEPRDQSKPFVAALRPRGRGRRGHGPPRGGLPPHGDGPVRSP